MISPVSITQQTEKRRETAHGITPHESVSLSSWCHQESNRGHKDFQSFALPTELWHHWQFFFLGAEATRFELVVRLPVRQFSKLLVSATHPHFQSHSALELRCKDRVFFLILQILPSLSLQMLLLFARRGGGGEE